MTIEHSSVKSKGRFILMAIPWVFLVVSLAFSVSSLTHAAYWLSLVAFFILLFIMVVAGDSRNRNDIENNECLFLLPRRQSMILGIVGLSALFIFAAVMNASVSRAIKEDVFHGVTTGACAGIALAIAIMEAFKNRTPD